MVFNSRLSLKTGAFNTHRFDNQVEPVLKAYCSRVSPAYKVHCSFLLGWSLYTGSTVYTNVSSYDPLSMGERGWENTCLPTPLSRLCRPSFLCKIPKINYYHRINKEPRRHGGGQQFLPRTLAPASRSYPNHSLWHNGIVGLRRLPIYFVSSFAKREMAQNIVAIHLH